MHWEVAVQLDILEVTADLLRSDTELSYIPDIPGEVAVHLDILEVTADLLSPCKKSSYTPCALGSSCPPRYIRGYC